MRRFAICTILFLVVLFLFLSVTQAEQNTTNKLDNIRELSHSSGKLGPYCALVIGIDKYEDSRFDTLTTAVADAKAIGRALRNRYGFQVKYLIDGEATQRAIYNALRNLVETSRTDESTLIYYAGHGDEDKILKSGWWIPADAKKDNPLTFLDNEKVRSVVREMKSRHVLVISDSCYAGTLFSRKDRSNAPGKGNRYYLELYNSNSRWGWTSGNKEPVVDSGGGGHSVFAHHLLNTLQNNTRRHLSVQEICVAINPIVANIVEQTPICDRLGFAGDLGGQFVFVSTSGVAIPKPSETIEGSTLRVETNIKDAPVYIDGRFVGVTPLELDIKAGEHLVLVQKQPNQKYYKIVDIPPRRTFVLYAQILSSDSKNVSLGTKASEPIFTNHLGMTFVRLRAGKFMMGSPSYEKGRDEDEVQHEVRLTEEFYVQISEVTQKQWKFIMDTNPSYFKGCGEDCPVEQVSFGDVQSFISKLNQLDGINKYRLPTEAEWEYACRAGRKNKPFSFGSCLSSKESNFNGKYTLAGCEIEEFRGQTVPVKSFSPNKWGLYDMHGNVWEWCEDRYGDYPTHSVIDPKGPSYGKFRVGRGGGWKYFARFCRSADRDGLKPMSRRPDLGFRLVISKQ